MGGEGGTFSLRAVARQRTPSPGGSPELRNQQDIKSSGLFSQKWMLEPREGERPAGRTAGQWPRPR